MHFRYAWWKAFDLVDEPECGKTGAELLQPELWPAAFERRHIAMLAYSYNLPRFSDYWQNGFARLTLTAGTLRDYEISKRAPIGLGYTLDFSTDLTSGTGNALDSRRWLAGWCWS